MSVSTEPSGVINTRAQDAERKMDEVENLTCSVVRKGLFGVTFICQLADFDKWSLMNANFL